MDRIVDLDYLITYLNLPLSFSLSICIVFKHQISLLNIFVCLKQNIPLLRVRGSSQSSGLFLFKQQWHPTVFMLRVFCLEGYGSMFYAFCIEKLVCWFPFIIMCEGVCFFLASSSVGVYFSSVLSL